MDPEIDTLTGEVIGDRDHIAIFPATHFLTSDDVMNVALPEIKDEMEKQIAKFEKEGKLLEAQRLKQRTTYDIEMMRRWDIPVGLKTIPGSWTAESRDSRRLPC